LTISGERWAALTDAFHNAAIDGGGWHEALRGLASATGSRCGQLLGLGLLDNQGFAGETFNIITDFDLAVPDAIMEVANDPAHNPRVRAGLAAPVHQVLTEADFLDADTHRRHPHYREFAVPFDIPHSCLTTLIRGDGVNVGLAVLRSADQGHIDEAQRAVFAAATPVVSAAVRTQIALENHGNALLNGALEGMSMAAFLCDKAGAVRTLTPSAERLVARGGRLRLRNGRLVLSNDPDTARLNQAVLAATELAGPHRKLIQTIVCRSVKHRLPLVLEVIALPAREYEMTFPPRVMIIVGGRRKARRSRSDTLRAAYCLTEAEADIALRLGAGESPDEIAADRRVAVGTVRTQIKTLLAKLGVKRQAGLVALLGRLG
jgi:DNA-binding CsgD family transcriptional regulator